MKTAWCLAVVCAVGCGGKDGGPLAVLSPSSASASASTGTPAEVPQPAPVAVPPGLVIDGATGCQKLSADMRWIVKVNNAGAGGVNGFLVGAFHDGAAGCGATQQGDLGYWWLKHVAGPESYLPTETGETWFAAQNRWQCGRDQFDISIRGQGLILSLVVDHGVDCTPESPKPPTVPPAEPPGPPATPPTRTPPSDPPAEPVCVNTNELFVGGWFGVVARVSDLFPGSDRVRVVFEGTLKPEFKNVSLTMASWKKRSDDPFPQDIDTVGQTHGYTGFFSMEIEAAKTRRQTDLFRCGQPEFSVLDEGTNAILGPRAVWYEQSEPGMLSAAAFRLRGR